MIRRIFLENANSFALFMVASKLKTTTKRKWGAKSVTLTTSTNRIWKNISKWSQKKRLAIACIWSTFKFGHVKLSNVLQIWSFYKCKKKSNLNNFPISTNFKIWTIFSHKLSLHFNNFHSYTLLKCGHFPKFNFTTTIKWSEKKMGMRNIHTNYLC